MAVGEAAGAGAVAHRGLVGPGRAPFGPSGARRYGRLHDPAAPTAPDDAAGLPARRPRRPDHDQRRDRSRQGRRSRAAPPPRDGPRLRLHGPDGPDLRRLAVRPGPDRRDLLRQRLLRLRPAHRRAGRPTPPAPARHALRDLGGPRPALRGDAGLRGPDEPHAVPRGLPDGGGGGGRLRDAPSARRLRDPGQRDGQRLRGGPRPAPLRGGPLRSVRGGRRGARPGGAALRHRP